MNPLQDPASRARVYDLFDEIWPGMSKAIHAADAIGAPWHERSAAFVAWDGPVAVAHAGVMEFPVVLDGRKESVSGIHAVCTRPEYRRRGLSRRLVTEALAHAAARTKTSILGSGDRTLYERYGFRVIPQTLFEVPALEVAPGGTPFRPLSADSRDDVDLVHRLLRARAPVSRTLASVDPGWLFIIDEMLHTRGTFRRLHYSADMDTVVAYERAGNSMKLYDVVATRIPPLAEVTRRIPGKFERVELHFTPDSIQAPAARPFESKVDDELMAIGPFAPEGQALVLPPLARC
jgi:predicted N-acetyltransferase YhbS